MDSNLGVAGWKPSANPAVNCDLCSRYTALMWFWHPETRDALTLCDYHGSVHGGSLSSRGYLILGDDRPQTPEALRRRLLDSPPSVLEVLAFELL